MNPSNIRRNRIAECYLLLLEAAEKKPRPSQIKDNGLLNQALETLRSGGQIDIEVDYSQIPAEAAESLQEEMDISLTAGAGLAASILGGKYEDRGAALSSRLAMWATTALGAYALGQLWQLQIWEYGPTVEHCADCKTLRGQVHTLAEWRDFFLRTGKRPQSRSLACGGWNCLCGLYDTGESASGDFA